MNPASSAIAATSRSPFDARRSASVAMTSIRGTSIASAMARNRRIASTVRRKLSAESSPVSIEPGAEPAQRLLVEPRERRAAEPVVDDEPDRVGADVDDREGRPIVGCDALGEEL